MNITSYNVTDVGYHYIGLRVLGALSSEVSREEQTRTISGSVRKYATDRAYRLMLPEPRGTFESVGGKVCQELVHFEFAESIGGAYRLTEAGAGVLNLLENRKFTELRRAMIAAHIKTYDNLRQLIQRHLELDGVWRPIVEAGKVGDDAYIVQLLEPAFGVSANEQAAEMLAQLSGISPGKLEDHLRNAVIKQTLPGVRLSESLYKSLGSRLVSLRLLNLRRSQRNGCEFEQSYATCAAAKPPNRWYQPLEVCLNSGEQFAIHLCEPDMREAHNQGKLLGAIRRAFSQLQMTAGYYSLPDVRDAVCELIKIPEAAFDEGLNCLLDQQPSPFTLGLEYEGISGRRKPFVRDRGSTQIYNLMRSV